MVNKEHLETDLTIKTSFKVGHMVDTPSNCSIFRPPGSIMHAFAWEK